MPPRLGVQRVGPIERFVLDGLWRLPVRAALDRVADAMAAEAFEHVPNTAVFNIGGQPAASLPLWWTSDGLPVGVQIAAKRGAEDVLLALAAQLEAVSAVGRSRPARRLIGLS